MQGWTCRRTDANLCRAGLAGRREIKALHPGRAVIVEIENTFIEMRDGVRLAARIWLPADAEAKPVPAIVEYIPYRKRDEMVERDESLHPQVAEHGYACLRVDLR